MSDEQGVDISRWRDVVEQAQKELPGMCSPSHRAQGEVASSAKPVFLSHHTWSPLTDQAHNKEEMRASAMPTAHQPAHRIEKRPRDREEEDRKRYLHERKMARRKRRASRNFSSLPKTSPAQQPKAPERDIDEDEREGTVPGRGRKAPFRENWETFRASNVFLRHGDRLTLRPVATSGKGIFGRGAQSGPVSVGRRPTVRSEAGEDWRDKWKRLSAAPTGTSKLRNGHTPKDEVRASERHSSSSGSAPAYGMPCPSPRDEVCYAPSWPTWRTSPTAAPSLGRHPEEHLSWTRPASCERESAEHLWPISHVPSVLSRHSPSQTFAPDVEDCLHPQVQAGPHDYSWGEEGPLSRGQYHFEGARYPIRSTTTQWSWTPGSSELWDEATHGTAEWNSPQISPYHNHWSPRDQEQRTSEADIGTYGREDLCMTSSAIAGRERHVDRGYDDDFPFAYPPTSERYDSILDHGGYTDSCGPYYTKPPYPQYDDHMGCEAEQWEYPIPSSGAISGPVDWVEAAGSAPVIGTRLPDEEENDRMPQPAVSTKHMEVLDSLIVAIEEETRPQYGYGGRGAGSTLGDPVYKCDVTPRQHPVRWSPFVTPPVIPHRSRPDSAFQTPVR